MDIHPPHRVNKAKFRRSFGTSHCLGSPITSTACPHLDLELLYSITCCNAEMNRFCNIPNKMDLLKMIGRIFRAYVCFLMFFVGSSNKRWAEQATGRFTTDLKALCKALVVVGHLSNGILDDINQHHQQNTVLSWKGWCS